MNKENTILRVRLVDGSDWSIKIKRTYAERLIKRFNDKIFKRGSLLVGNLERGEMVQVFNIRHITTMAIQENSDASGEKNDAA